MIGIFGEWAIQLQDLSVDSRENDLDFSPACNKQYSDAGFGSTHRSLLFFRCIHIQLAADKRTISPKTADAALPDRDLAGKITEEKGELAE